MVEANTDFPLSIARGIIEELRDLLICMQKKMSWDFQNPFEVDAAACSDSL